MIVVVINVIIIIVVVIIIVIIIIIIVIIFIIISNLVPRPPSAKGPFSASKRVRSGYEIKSYQQQWSS